MKKLLVGLTTLCTGCWIFAQLQPSGEPLPTLFPGGPLLYCEARNLSALLRDWRSSPERSLWLKSDNYSVFSRSHLIGRLQTEQQAFAEAAGFSPEMSLVDAVAGGRSALAIYDINKLEFLYITRLPSSRTLETLIGAARTSYESRSIAGRAYFVRNGPAKTVAFGVANGLLFLSTREDLLANALALLSKQSRLSALSQDKWFKDAVAASKGEGDVRMVFQMPALIANTSFRSYWIQRNRGLLAEFSTGITDLFRESNQIREERVLVRDNATTANTQEAAAGQISSYAPTDAGLTRLWAAPGLDAVVGLIRAKLVEPGPQTAPQSRFAPAAVTTDSNAGSEADLETPIDLPPLPVENQSADMTPLRALLEPNNVQAMLHLQSSRPTPGGLFVANTSGVVLLGAATWDETGIRSALPGVEVLVQGRVLVLSDRPETLAKIAARLTAAPGPAVTYRAQYLHRQEFPAFTAMMRSIDAGREQGGRIGFALNEGSTQPGVPHEPSFFSQNVASLGTTLGRMESATLTLHDSGAAVLQQMIYKLAP